MIVTRFNPSVNGNLHLGHVYAMLVNERFAHDNGGKFYVRFDDTSQAIMIEMEHIERVEEIIKNQKSDIEWLGIPVDGWSRQGDTFQDIKKVLSRHYHLELTDPYPHYLPVSIRMGNSWIPYPYTPYQTAERVLLDKALGVTHLIRGEEFLTEYSLYRFFCDTFDFPFPKFISLPRLQGECGDISKTNGGYTIAELRGEGYMPRDIIGLLEKACLHWAHNGWDINNLKSEPRIDL